MVSISHSTVTKVKKALEYNACKTFNELTPLEEITLARDVTLQQYQKWVGTTGEKKRKEWGLKIEYLDGKIIATELAGRNHAWAVGRLMRMLIRQDQNDDLQIGVEEDIDVAGGQCYTADMTINVKGDYIGASRHLVNLQGNGFTVAVVEIGVAQSGSDLCKKLELYSTVPSLQFYLAVKRYSADGMVALKFERANAWQPVSIISFGLVPLHSSVVSYIHGQWPGQQPIVGVGFGGRACDAVNLAPYVVHLPSATIFIEHAGGVPVAAPGAYQIDLFEMSELLRI